MYLINVQSMQTEFFQNERDVVYAILSHRWQKDEVLFQDLQSGRAHEKAGYTKLKRFCEQAKTNKYTYVWCDTCCIDKSSSTELSESVNSMFRWYQNADICYAYLSDVTSTKAEASDFNDSEWFRRGWCLQELLAPSALQFYNRDWIMLGTKEELSQRISEITRIHDEAIRRLSIDNYSIAQRMCWATGRQTTRVEDIAYSLLGIFKVNMPLVYGEGERAFIRLQQEIIKQSNDQSILVHSSSGPSQLLLATSPSDFRQSSHIVRSEKPLLGKPYTLTNVGLSIELMLYPWSLDTYIALLDSRDNRECSGHVSIFLRLLPETSQENPLSVTGAFRIKLDGQAWVSRIRISGLPLVKMQIYLKDNHPEKASVPPKRYGFWIRRFKGTDSFPKDGKVWAVSWNKWNKADRIFEIPDGSYATAGVLQMEYGKNAVCLRLGFSHKFVPIIQFRYHQPYDPMRLSKSGALSNKVSLLSDMSWLTESESDSTSYAFLHGKSRDMPMHENDIFSRPVSVAISCEKLVVKGVETWVVDVLWRKLEEDCIQNPLRPDKPTCNWCQKVTLF